MLSLGCLGLGIAFLVAGVILAAVGEFFEDKVEVDTSATPPTIQKVGQTFTWQGAATEVCGWAAGLLGAAMLFLIVPNLSDLDHARSYLKPLNAGVQSTPTFFTVADGKASWEVQNPHIVLWYALTVEPKNADRFTIVLKPYDVQRDAKGRLTFEDVDNLKDAAEVTLWYGTEEGPSPMATFPAKRKEKSVGSAADPGAAGSPAIPVKSTPAAGTPVPKSPVDPMPADPMPPAPTDPMPPAPASADPDPSTTTPDPKTGV